ncbi:hypothetical protein PJP07_31410 [Mycobacterium kansasii]
MSKILLETKSTKMSKDDFSELEEKAMSIICLCLLNEVIYNVLDKESALSMWKKLEVSY